MKKIINILILSMLLLLLCSCSQSSNSDAKKDKDKNSHESVQQEETVETEALELSDEVRLDGLYCYIYEGDDGFLRNSVLRFYDDGKVLYSTVAQNKDNPEYFPMPTWFCIESDFGQEMHGSYTVSGNEISIVTDVDNGTVDFKGTIYVNAFILVPQSDSHGQKGENLKYEFYPFTELEAWQ